MNDFLQTVYKLVSFELLPEDTYGPVADEILQLPSDVAFSTEFVVFNTETGYILCNLFLPLAMILCFTLQFLMYYLLYYVTKSLAICKKRRKSWRANYRKAPGFYIRSFIELSLELSLLSIVELVMRQIEEWNERLSFFVGAMGFMLVMIFIVVVYLMMSSANSQLK